MSFYKAANALEVFGIYRAVLPFHGGDDEGGFQPSQAKFYDERGDVIEQPDIPGQLWEQLEAPLDKYYYSFACEFFVTGELVWDIKLKQILLIREHRNRPAHEDTYRYNKRAFGGVPAPEEEEPEQEFPEDEREYCQGMPDYYKREPTTTEVIYEWD